MSRLLDKENVWPQGPGRQLLKRILAVVLLLALTVCCGAGQAGEIAFSGPVTLGEINQVGYDAGQDNFAVAAIGENRCIFVWNSTDSLDGKIGDDSDILFSLGEVTRGVDQNKTLSCTEPTWLNTTAVGDTDHDTGVSVASDGEMTMAVWASTADLGMGLQNDMDILYARLPDGAAQWSDPAPVNADARTDLTIKIKGKTEEVTEAAIDIRPMIATDGQGHWMAVWERDPYYRGFVSVLDETEEDPEWGDPVELPLFAGEWHSGLAYGNGVWMISVDTNLEPYVFVSSDGSAWSKVTTGRWDDAFLDQQVATDGKGTWVEVTWKREMVDSQLASGQVLIKVSDDNGNTWHPQRPLHSNTDMFPTEYYPTVAVDHNGVWMVAFSSRYGEEDWDYNLVCYRTTDPLGEWVGPLVVRRDHPDGTTIGSVPMRLAYIGDGSWIVANQAVTGDLSKRVLDVLVGDYPPLPDTPRISIAPANYVLKTSEADVDSQSFDVVLSTAPTHPVTIPVASSDISEGTVSPSSLEFYPDDETLSQTVTITSKDDDPPEADGDITYMIELGPVSSEDLGYHGLYVPQVFVQNIDDDAIPVAKEVRVDTITYATERDGKDLLVTLTLMDDLDIPVPDTVVGIDLFQGDVIVLKDSGVTDANGSVTIKKRNAKAGVYTTEVITVRSDLAWDRITPPNECVVPIG